MLNFGLRRKFAYDTVSNKPANLCSYKTIEMVVSLNLIIEAQKEFFEATQNYGKYLGIENK